MTTNPTNNIFNFATNELSQDALLCYWLNFASPTHAEEAEAERKSAQDLLFYILTHSNLTDFNIKKEDLVVTAIQRQFLKTDVLIEVNETYLILIEDKIYTSEHSDQITRYIDSLTSLEEHPFNMVLTRDKIVPVYYKMINQSLHGEHYLSVERDTVLDILNPYTFTNLSMMAMYQLHLQTIDNQVKHFDTIPLDEWRYNHYFGLFSKLATSPALSNDTFQINSLSNGGVAFYAAWCDFPLFKTTLSLKNEDYTSIMLSSPKDGSHHFTLEFRYNFIPKNYVNANAEKQLFSTIEEIRSNILKINTDFNRKYCPKSIYANHKKENKINTMQSVRLAKIVIPYTPSQSFVEQIETILFDFKETTP